MSDEQESAPPLGDKLGQKDAFPTNEMKDQKGDTFVWPGPGLTVREYTAIHIAAGLSKNLGGVLAEDEVSKLAIKQTDSLLKYLESGWKDGDDDLED